ncbi:MAG: exopolysaccharide biosynthesis polyprenyl glycosylphosphotransferase [Ruminococcus sp.]|nr:exopolysaccharide biosynthesis polyprenyl glycosylphosphotransferase [Ruminococcus sp.]
MVMFMFALIIVIVLGAAFNATWQNYYNYSPELRTDTFWARGNILLELVYMLVYIMFSRLVNGYKVGSLKISGLVLSQMLAIIMTNFVMYIMISLIRRGFLSLAPMFALTMFDLAVAIIWSIASKKVYAHIYPPKRMIIVYGSKAARDLVQKMSMRVDKYIICTSISISVPLEEIKEKVVDYDGLIICDIPADIRNKLLKFAYEKSLRTYINPKISDIILKGCDEIHVLDTPLYLSRNIGFTFEEKIIKRTIDIVLSLVCVILTSPIMLICALLIKLYDRGPVFYKQVRLTRDRKEFYVYKFRSMIENAEKDGKARLATEKDDRITPVGRFMRKVRFDELPQLLNVLKGDMSFVGPRPERPEIAEAYEHYMPEFAYRLKVKAGLTGYAQILGKYNTTPYDKLKLDLMYIEQYSLLLDLRILLQTIKILFTPESTEGIAEDEYTPSAKAPEKIKESGNND